jgi:hypothetical protein
MTSLSLACIQSHPSASNPPTGMVDSASNSNNNPMSFSSSQGDRPQVGWPLNRDNQYSWTTTMGHPNMNTWALNTMLSSSSSFRRRNADNEENFPPSVDMSLLGSRIAGPWDSHKVDDLSYGLHPVQHSVTRKIMMSQWTKVHRVSLLIG